MFKKRLILVCLHVFIATFFIQCQPAQSPMKNTSLERIFKKYKRPPFLKLGDTIMVVAPAGYLNDSTDLDAGIELAKSWGVSVVLGKHIFDKYNHFAGKDEDRLSDIQEAIDRKDIQAIWCSKGGYGTVRILDQIDFSEFKKHPKWLIGFSDITALHAHIHNLGVETIHATMPGGIKSASAEAKLSLQKSLFGVSYTVEIPSNPLNKQGKAEAVLIGGNLSMIVSMIGSKSQYKTSGKILFLEDLSEDLYRLDRMMYSLKRSGALKNLKGIIVGDFSYKIDQNTKFGGTHREIILNAVKEYNYPVIFDLPAGHIRDNRTLIFGGKVKIEAGEITSKVSN